MVLSGSDNNNITITTFAFIPNNIKDADEVYFTRNYVRLKEKMTF